MNAITQNKAKIYSETLRAASLLVELQKKLQNALEEKNKILSNINEAFFSKNMLTGEITFLSNAHEKIYGYSNEEMRANPNLWFEVIYPDDKKLIEEKMLLHEQGETTYDEHRIIRKDGKIIWIEGKVTPTLDENRRLIRIDGSISDISKRKKAEFERDEKILEMNTFLYRTTHDLTSPVASFSALIHLAEKEISNKKSKIFFDMLKLSVKKMQATLADLTSIIQAANRKINPEIINFKHLIEDIKHDFRFLPNFEKINFSVTIQQQSEFRTDIKLLSSILHNLIGNSVKYMKNSEPAIHIRITEDSKGVKIEIKDNGIGIQKQLQPKIFDMFFRATEFSEGTGLGLYIVKISVQKLFGKITVKSAEGKGSLFTVLLPNMVKYLSTHETSTKPNNILNSQHSL